MKYFSNITTAEELKKQFRDLIYCCVEARVKR